MIRTAIPKQLNEKHWKDLFEGSISRLTGQSIPASKQPIFRARQERSNIPGSDSSNAAIATAAASLAALWQVSGSNRQHRHQ
jgi:hypothetical protein